MLCLKSVSNCSPPPTARCGANHKPAHVDNISICHPLYKPASSAFHSVLASATSAQGRWVPGDAESTTACSGSSQRRRPCPCKPRPKRLRSGSDCRQSSPRSVSRYVASLQASACATHWSGQRSDNLAACPADRQQDERAARQMRCAKHCVAPPGSPPIVVRNSFVLSRPQVQCPLEHAQL